MGILVSNYKIWSIGNSGNILVMGFSFLKSGETARGCQDLDAGV